jgi:hypothetical protein
MYVCMYVCQLIILLPTINHHSWRC